MNPVVLDRFVGTDVPASSGRGSGVCMSAIRELPRGRKRREPVFIARSCCYFWTLLLLPRPAGQVLLILRTRRDLLILGFQFASSMALGVSWQAGQPSSPWSGQPGSPWSGQPCSLSCTFTRYPSLDRRDEKHFVSIHSIPRSRLSRRETFCIDSVDTEG